MVKKRLTFGCFIGRIEEGYQLQVSEGINSFCINNDINLIYYAGRPINHPNNFEALCNILYDFLNSKKIDGLIILSGSLCQFSDREKLENILQKYKHIPKVSISIPFDNIPSILIDNQKGMNDIVEHFIKVHNCQKIAFIKGPENHSEAESRFLGYKNALIENKIPFNPDLVVSGNFLEDSGAEAIQTLINERKISFDALAVANDDMALGALVELEKLNISVPKDIAIAGFDDLMKSRVINLPLTTIRQPLYNSGFKAGEVLLEMINGKKIEESISLPTKMIIRRSCGCFSKILTDSSVIDTDLLNINFQDKLTTNKRIIALLQKSLNIKNTSIEFEHIKKLNYLFLNNLEEKNSQSFLIEFDQIFKNYSPKILDLEFWHNFISEMRQYYIPYLISNHELCIHAENIFHKSRILIGETQKRIQLFQNYEEDKTNLIFLACIESFHLAQRIPNLIELITKQIKLLGIKSCYLSLYEDPNKLHKLSKTILAFDERGYLKLKSNEAIFKTIDLIPDKISQNERRYTWIVEALRSQEGKQFGFVVLEPEKEENIKYGRISYHISAAIQESYLFEVREDLMKKLANTNAQLEEFGYIVSHDLKTPLTSILGFLSFALSKYESDFTSESRELIEFAIKNAKEMNNLITDLLRFSHETQTEMMEEKIECNELISEIITNLKLIIEEKDVKINYSKLPIIIGHKTQIKQLFQNLIENAIKFQTKNHPTIQIEVKKKNDEWLFSVSDNGIGIDPAYFEKIFTIFGRINKGDDYPGTGIGLAICKKVVENHGGCIWVESTLNKGSTFYFTLPYHNFN